MQQLYFLKMYKFLKILGSKIIMYDKTNSIHSLTINKFYNNILI